MSKREAALVRYINVVERFLDEKDCDDGPCYDNGQKVCGTCDEIGVWPGCSRCQLRRNLRVDRVTLAALDGGDDE